ncbi:MAG: 6-carboxytetrahydropterin synthase [Candidatus Zixiibacteriota bacterium]|nr:MAG: 6-carboxytetrahydropterin synthase [candidate division Zixibacteria bacterium]
MFSVTVRDHILVAHSLRGAMFGPAQALHGATYVIEAEFRRPDLDASNVVMDMGRAAAALREAASRLNYRNLDEAGEFRGEITTTEFLARYLHGEISRQVEGEFHGGLKVTLRESPDAWAAYEAEVGT